MLTGQVDMLKLSQMNCQRGSLAGGEENVPGAGGGEPALEQVGAGGVGRGIYLKGKINQRHCLKIGDLGRWPERSSGQGRTEQRGAQLQFEQHVVGKTKQSVVDVQMRWASVTAISVLAALWAEAVTARATKTKATMASRRDIQERRLKGQMFKCSQ